MSMLIRGSSELCGDEGEEGGEGLDMRSIKGSEEGMFSMRSESGVVDMLIERMVGGESERMAKGCLL